VAFAERLGPLTLGHPTLASPPDQPQLEEIDSAKGTRANHWHTDVTFVDRPPAFTLLHGVVIPAVGGDTIWANTVTAYQSLPAELTARFLVTQGRLTTVPTAAQIAAHVDITLIKKALAGDCPD
jgi:alpha-ketoglutarate-dependent taurine dioxygenase